METLWRAHRGAIALHGAACWRAHVGHACADARRMHGARACVHELVIRRMVGCALRQTGHQKGNQHGKKRNWPPHPPVDVDRRLVAPHGVDQRERVRRLLLGGLVAERRVAAAAADGAVVKREHLRAAVAMREGKSASWFRQGCGLQAMRVSSAARVRAGWRTLWAMQAAQAAISACQRRIHSIRKPRESKHSPQIHCRGGSRRCLPSAPRSQTPP